MTKKYDKIVRHYEDCLDQHGDTHKGVDWPNPEDAEVRYSVMLGITTFHDANGTTSILDFGCGTGHLLEYISGNTEMHIEYSGLDISKKFVDVARSKFPNNTFYCLDILETPIGRTFDFIVMNGVFTEKRELSFDEMWEYFTNILKVVFDYSDKGIAFNVMSKNVDWEREDLFHVSLDKLTDFLVKNLTRNFVIRNDYGLYEYTVYVYKN